MVEPWLRGTWTEVDAVRRQVLHALQLAREDAGHWCAALSDEEISARPHGIAPVAFHLRHIARSLDRLLTYAEGGALSEFQFDQLATESQAKAATAEVIREFERAIEDAMQRVMRLSVSSFPELRAVGRDKLPSTVGGLLVHCAEHTQRHIGQAITTAKVVRSEDRSGSAGSSLVTA